MGGPTLLVAISPRSGSKPVRRIALISHSGSFRQLIEADEAPGSDAAKSPDSLALRLCMWLLELPQRVDLVCPDRRTTRRVRALLQEGGVPPGRVKVFDFTWLTGSELGRRVAADYWREHPPAERRNVMAHALALREQFCCHFLSLLLDQDEAAGNEQTNDRKAKP